VNESFSQRILQRNGIAYEVNLIHLVVCVPVKLPDPTLR